MIMDDDKKRIVGGILAMGPDNKIQEKEPDPKDLELLAHDLMDAVHKRDAMACVHALEAIWCHFEYEEDQETDGVHPDEGEP